MKPFNITLSGQELTVDSTLKDFQIYSRKSSFIAFIATQADEGKLFIQFNNGNCAIFEGVPKEIIAKAVMADSIGKLYHAELKDKFTAVKLDDNLITVAEAEDDEVLPDEDVFGFI